MCHVVLYRLAEYYDVGEVDKGRFRTDSEQYWIYRTLDCLWRIQSSRGYSEGLVESTGAGKGRVYEPFHLFESASIQYLRQE